MSTALSPLLAPMLSSAAMRAICDDVACLQNMLDFEATLARAEAAIGIIPDRATRPIEDACKAGAFDLTALAEAATKSGNLAIPLVKALTAAVAKADAEAARYVHWGATSQDVIDTASMLTLRAAIDALLADLDRAIAGFAKQTRKHRHTAMVGRTWLQHALPMPFGLKLAEYAAALNRSRARLRRLRTETLALQFGGAAGTLASLGPAGAAVKSLMASELGLVDPPLPWHTERLRIIDVAVAMARVTAALSKIARDVTLLAQTEVGEVSEGAPAVGGTGGGPRRGGSSAMPNKSNPVAAVAILGCARQAGGLLATLVASAEQEHQRAAGAWHAEWQPFSHLLQLAVAAASWARDLLENLTVDTARMTGNLAAAGGLPMAERVTALLRDSLGGLQAHDLVATAAARAASAGVPLGDVLLATPDVADRLTQAGISAAEIEQALNPAGYLGASDAFIAAALAAHHPR